MWKFYGGSTAKYVLFMSILLLLPDRSVTSHERRILHCDDDNDGRSSHGGDCSDEMTTTTTTMMLKKRSKMRTTATTTRMMMIMMLVTTWSRDFDWLLSNTTVQPLGHIATKVLQALLLPKYRSGNTPYPTPNTPFVPSPYFSKLTNGAYVASTICLDLYPSLTSPSKLKELAFSKRVLFSM